jgi:hypothetical protein
MDEQIRSRSVKKSEPVSNKAAWMSNTTRPRMPASSPVSVFISLLRNPRVLSDAFNAAELASTSIGAADRLIGLGFTVVPLLGLPIGLSELDLVAELETGGTELGNGEKEKKRQVT